MNKPVYLGLSVLEISKIAMYDVWYHFVKQKYGEFKKQNYVTWDSGSFVIIDLHLCRHSKKCRKKL